MGLKTNIIRINGVEYDLASSGGSDIDVIDNLTTEDSESALSANQGKVLNDKVETIKTQAVMAEYHDETGSLELEFNTPVQGIVEDTLESDNSYNALSANQGRVLKEAVDEASSIAKGRNKARVFATTEAMNEWISDEANKGLANVGDNLYIVDVGVPDWWISKVLEEANEAGEYYEVAQLETQKVDLTTINNSINDLVNSRDKLLWSNNTATGGTQPQTITFSDTDYDYLEIHSTYNGSLITPFVIYKGLQTFMNFSLHNGSSSPKGYLYQRVISLSADGTRLVISDGKSIIISDSSPEVANDKHTIYKIIGKKLQ